MTALRDRVRGHKTERLNQLENIIAVNDDRLLDIKHIKIIAKAIVDAQSTKIDLKNIITLGDIIILNDNELLDIEHIKKVANAIAKAYDKIEWERLGRKQNDEIQEKEGT